MPEHVQQPKIAILIPAYNEERFVRENLESVLSQDYGNYDVFISDNASTDRTWQEIQLAAGGKGNVFSYRQPRNVGAIDNALFVYEEARKRGGYKYACAIGAHDVLDKRYLSKLCAAMECDPSASLAYFLARYIGEDGRDVDAGKFSDYTYPGLGPVERYLHFVNEVEECTCFNGMMRFEDASFPRERLRIKGGDIVMLTRLLHKGQFVRVPELLFARRMFDPKSDTRDGYDSRIAPGKKLSFDEFLKAQLDDMWEVMEGNAEQKLEISLFIFAAMSRKYGCSVPGYFAAMRDLMPDFDHKVIGFRGRSKDFDSAVARFLKEDAARKSEAGDLDSAEATIRCAMEFDPSVPGLLESLARLLAHRGDLAGAQVAYTQAVQLAPGSAEAQANLAGILIVRGQPERAESHLLETLRLAPNHAEASLALARIHLERAAGYAKRFLDDAPPSHPGRTEMEFFTRRAK